MDNDQELLACALCNTTGAFFGCFVATQAPPRTLVHETAGGRTQLAGAVSTLVPLVVVVAVGPLFEALPVSVLGCITSCAILPLMKQFTQLRQEYALCISVVLMWYITVCVLCVGRNTLRTSVSPRQKKSAADGKVLRVSPPVQPSPQTCTRSFICDDCGRQFTARMPHRSHEDSGGLAIRAFGQCPVGRCRWVKNGPLAWMKNSWKNCHGKLLFNSNRLTNPSIFFKTVITVQTLWWRTVGWSFSKLFLL